MTGEAAWRLHLSSEAETQQLAKTVAGFLKAGDLLTLSGDLGAGKTAFARALIRSLTKDADLDVPSPTFTLLQTYDGAEFPIVHADLYRIKTSAELAELGWDEATESALVLIEWAEKAGELPLHRLDIRFTLSDENEEARDVVLTGYGSFSDRLARARDIDGILKTSQWAEAKRIFMQGDASARAYERLVRDDCQTAILMISPQRPDGPPVRFGKPYSAIAHLAENIRPFIAMADALRAEGLSAPEIYAADAEAGLAVLEDLGAEGVVDENGPIRERYMDAVAALAHLHDRNPTETVRNASGESYRIPPYDLDALLIEIELLLDWFVPHVTEISIASGQRAMFVNNWRQTILEVANAPPTWTLRDYHSPNLLWLPKREGVRKIGIIDFQDCVMGHPAYDVVSLLQDARVTVSDELELRLLGHYAQLRLARDSEFDMAAFARAYAILGAQRATKILGIFARLDKRDHKPQYLAHIPRIKRYLNKNLAHPALARLREWHMANTPRLLETNG